MSAQTQPALEKEVAMTDQQGVRDKLWIFTVVAGGDNEGYGLPRPSRMTPSR